ncbi:MAG: DUF448 domain-containing protein [Desulfuromonadales bacterium]|nr:DUF448 domain-containing protein [Desulfuromonadales bacterium]MBN2792402.1 DUF448 domain-containing protein [Desulfuromonadales bacterium]
MNTEVKGPQRTCVACRAEKNKKQLLRFVLSPGNDVLLDYQQRLPGRGVYVCSQEQCLKMAVKKQAFRRGFRRETKPLDFAQLQEQLNGAVEKKILNLIGMGRKSGAVISGTNAVLDALRKDPPPLVIMAPDISPSIGNKISQLAELKNVYWARMFSKQLLGQLVGKEERSAIAFNRGALADTLKFELQRFELLVREN